MTCPEASFDPAQATSWLARGRSPEHAAAIAAAWRDLPDLPNDAPVADRMARSRARVVAMRPVNDAIAAELEAKTQANNFAFVEGRERGGTANDRDLAILIGRDRHGYDWPLAQRYADGWYAAHAGWPHRYQDDAFPGRAPLVVRRAAYDQGFADGGGDRADLFDVARRGYLAQVRQSNMPVAPTSAGPGRPAPSSWPKPNDAPRPARWSRRLVILSAADVGRDDQQPGEWDYLRLIRARSGADSAAVLVLTAGGFVDAGGYVSNAGQHEPIHVTELVAEQQLRAAIAGRDFDDVLVALQGDELAFLDRIAGALPLCRTMERTRNTKLQRRTHLKLWLDRGFSEEAMAAGHIRWGKVIHGFIGKLGEFTARHVGPAESGGHLVRVETSDGNPAVGYAAADGSRLSPEIIVTSKARLRSEITRALRTFAGATAIMGVSQPDSL